MPGKALFDKFCKDMMASLPSIFLEDEKDRTVACSSEFIGNACSALPNTIEGEGLQLALSGFRLWLYSNESDKECQKIKEKVNPKLSEIRNYFKRELKLQELKFLSAKGRLNQKIKQSEYQIEYLEEQVDLEKKTVLSLGKELEENKLLVQTLEEKLHKVEFTNAAMVVEQTEMDKQHESKIDEMTKEVAYYQEQHEKVEDEIVTLSLQHESKMDEMTREVAYYQEQHEKAEDEIHDLSQRIEDKDEDIKEYKTRVTALERRCQVLAQSLEDMTNGLDDHATDAILKRLRNQIFGDENRIQQLIKMSKTNQEARVMLDKAVHQQNEKRLAIVEETLKKTLQQLKDAEDDNTKCGICITNRMNVVFDCGHVYCCHICEKELGNKCPKCRAPYQGNGMRIYL